jgi:hypothetical protein
MTAGTDETTLAFGGQRQVPVPDPVARDYLLLALRLDQHVPGLVDGYFGPADLKAQADMEELRPAARLADDADALLARIGADVPEPDRRGWLTAQVVALRTQAQALAGSPLPYVEHATRCFDWMPVRRDDSVFEEAAATIDALLPGDGHLADRLQAWDDRFVIPVERVPGVLEWLVATFRARAAATFDVPAGEDLRVRLVRNQPWTGYNWYDGGRRSRVDLNTDLPTRAAELIHVAAHETYPGHHLEHVTKEAELVDARRRLEASILLINTPECLVSEGLADLGHRFASPPADEPALLVELYGRAGLAIAADPPAARAAAEMTAALAPERGPGQCGHDAPCRRCVPRRGPRLARAGRPVRAGRGRQAPGVHRAPALADVRLRVPRGRGAPPALARFRAGSGRSRPLRTAPSRAADPDGDRRRAQGVFLTEDVIGASSIRYA